MPTNEAMLAAERLDKYYGITFYASEDQKKQIPFHIAETIDHQTHLPALLAVADAARIFVGFPAMGGEVMESARLALRAALEKLPPPQKPEM